MSDTPNSSQGVVHTDAIKQFQLTTEGIKDKSSREYGLAISKKIWATANNTGQGGYFFSRNARFLKNRNYANGRMDVQAMFQDRFRFDGKQNYIKLAWQTLQIVNRIVSGLVGRWMQRDEKIEVKAIDDLSQTQKRQEYENFEFIINNRKQLEQLQAASGVQMIPTDTEIPADKEELNLWQAQFQRIPEEIVAELGCNDVFNSNGLFGVLKEKLLHDAAEVLFVGTYTYMDKEGVIHVRWVKPEDAIYSYSEYPDFRDTTWRGEAPTIKISELRKKWGKEFNPDNPFALTEEQLWEIAQKAKEFQYNTNLTWVSDWYTAFLRPYDEWNVRSIQFEIKTVDSEPYTITNSTISNSTRTQKGLPTTSSGKLRDKPLPNQKVITDTSWNIYRGVYLPDCDKLIEWGLKDNMIRPQDPKEIGNAEFSYSFQMPQNYLMRNLAIPEKIEAAVDGMILALLKMQQVVARMRPTGAAVDESALQNIDYGLGDAGNAAIDYKKLYDQTGDIYYRGVDAEGNRVPVPIQELQNSGFLAQMDGLIKNYQFNYQILRDELGEDPNLMSSALQPRVTSSNVEASQSQAEAATDYIYDAYANCMEDTARKVSCLLRDSIKYGADAYRHIVTEDIGDRQFTTAFKLLPTRPQVDKFEAMMYETMKSTPEMTLFVDPFQMCRIAKEDVKLAELLFRRAQKKMLLWQQQTAQQNQQQTIQGQIDSAKAAEEEKRQTMQDEVEAKGMIESLMSKEKQKEIILTGIFGIYQKGVPMPPELTGLRDEIIKNVGIPLFAQNVEAVSQMQQAQQQPDNEQQENMTGQQEPPQQEQQEQYQQQNQQQPQVAA